MIDLAQLAREHVRWTYTENEVVKPVSAKVNPNSGKKPPEGEQCAKCKKAWPCETRQLLDVIDQLHREHTEAKA